MFHKQRDTLYVNKKKLIIVENKPNRQWKRWLGDDDDEYECDDE